MVRKTIACSHCRKLKIKCIHQGSPPCQQCQRKGRTRAGECLLTGPVLKRWRTQRPREHQPDPAPVALSRSSLTIEAEPPSSISCPHSKSLKIDHSTLAGAFRTLSRKFPEFRFIHWPLLSKSLQSLESDGQIEMRKSNGPDDSSSLYMLCASVMALCIPLMCDHSETLSSDVFASFTGECISIADPPDLLKVQALITLAMYEWGASNGHRAWMYTGAATRMMQSLRVMVKPDSLVGVESDVHNRTLWACFIMDRLVFCGKPQPFTLSTHSMATHWPISEDDFAFGESSLVHLTNEEQGPLAHMEGDMNNYYGILVRGFDIWARILSWIVSGGRRLPRMCLPENHPWVTGSPWRLLYDELLAWRNRQGRRLHYPKVLAAGHLALGKAEQFAYINLIYYVSLLFLGREYSRFLPTRDSEPKGPVDPPLLPLPAPTTWWKDRAEEVFTSAENIVRLLQELDENNEPLHTPFVGFCAFSAATMNLYVLSFPKMNLGRSRGMSRTVDLNMQFLDKFRGIWAMGQGWWLTVKHCKQLYDNASQDQSRLRGRTREDFTALDYSIHDVRGQPPTIEESPEAATNEPDSGSSTNHETVAAIGLQELSGQNSLYHEQLAEEDPDQYMDWSQIWPLWGEQNFIPIAVEGVPFDYNMRLGEQEP